MARQSQRPEAQVVILVDGTFDPMAARALHLRLAEMDLSARVVIDFSRAREVYDLGLALLAEELAANGRLSVQLSGLSHHHERMLRYLGLNPSGSGPGRPLHDGFLEPAGRPLPPRSP